MLCYVFWVDTTSAHAHPWSTVYLLLTEFFLKDLDNILIVSLDFTMRIEFVLLTVLRFVDPDRVSSMTVSVDKEELEWRLITDSVLFNGLNNDAS